MLGSRRDVVDLAGADILRNQSPGGARAHQFSITVPSHSLEQGVQVLADFVMNPSLNKSAIEVFLWFYLSIFVFARPRCFQGLDYFHSF